MVTTSDGALLDETADSSRHLISGGARRIMQVLIAVAVGYFLLQVFASGISRWASYDEAVYLTEVQRGATGVAFAAHRSRGASWLVWPTAALGAPLVVTRLWLATLSSVGLVLAFRPWIRSVGWGAPLAAALFAGSWVSVLFGNEVESSAFAALAVVTAVGFAVQPPGSGPRRTQLLGVGVAVAVLALFRPTDVAWVGLALALCLPVIQRWTGIGTVVAAGVGAVVGLIPWVVEAILRFDGPIHRLESVSNSTLGAGGVESVGPLVRVLQYLSLVDGPRALTSGSPREAFTNPEVSLVVWIGAVIVIAVVVAGTLAPRGTSSTGAVRTAAVGGLLFVLAYVGLTGYVHIRFLLPAWGLAAIPAAEALLRMVEPPGRRVLTGVALAMGVAWLAGQWVTLRPEAVELVEYRASVRALGTTVGDMVERPCYVYAEREYPTIALGSSCRTGPFAPGADRPVRHDPQALADEGLHVYGLTREPGPPLTDWPSREVPGQDDGYRLYERPPGG